MMFLSIPSEVFEQIMQYISPRDLYALRAASKQIHLKILRMKNDYEDKFFKRWLKRNNLLLSPDLSSPNTPPTNTLITTSSRYSRDSTRIGAIKWRQYCMEHAITQLIRKDIEKKRVHLHNHIVLSISFLYLKHEETLNGNGRAVLFESYKKLGAYIGKYNVISYEIPFVVQAALLSLDFESSCLYQERQEEVLEDLFLSDNWFAKNFGYNPQQSSPPRRRSGNTILPGSSSSNSRSSPKNPRIVYDEVEKVFYVTATHVQINYDTNDELWIKYKLKISPNAEVFVVSQSKKKKTSKTTFTSAFTRIFRFSAPADDPLRVDNENYIIVRFLC